MKRCLLAAAALVVTPFPATAFDGLSIRLRTSHLSAEAEAIIAEHAAPLHVQVHPGESPDGAVRRICPSASDSYRTVLRAKFEELNPHLGTQIVPSGPAIVDGQFSEETSVVIPFCLQAEHRIVQPGDVLWNYYRWLAPIDENLHDWESFVKDVARLNKMSPAALQDLEVGTALVLPKLTVEIPMSASEYPAIADALQDEIGAGDVFSLDAANWGFSDNVGEACDDPGGQPSDVSEAIFHRTSNALMLNAFIETLNDWERDFDKIGIVILDRGSLGDSHPFITSISTPLGASVSPDDVRPLPEDPDGKHGTNVLALSMGGHLLGWLSPLLDMINVASYRVFENHDSRIVAIDHRLIRGLEHAFEPGSGIQIANVSLRFTRDIYKFSAFLGWNKPVLIVVSAGNGSEQLDENYVSYPAMHGGKWDRNLITVGAVDSKGTWLSFSHHSAEYVDIAAWGCEVPTLDYVHSTNAFQTIAQSGTSFAAPQVAFVAALLLRERREQSRRMTPVQVKRRIIFSADLNAHLWKKVRFGAALNPEKALSKYTDLVELDDGRLLRGKLSFDGEAEGRIVLCPEVDMPISELRKIADVGASVGGSPGPKKRYVIFREKDDVANPDEKTVVDYECDSIFPSMTLELVGKEKETVPIDLTLLKDVVMALRT